MRQILTGLTLMAALGALAPATDARAPKLPLFTTAAVEFRDGPGDKVTSDGTTWGSSIFRLARLGVVEGVHTS